jgi:hypothetical protein
MAFERIKRLKRAFSGPTKEEQAQKLQERVNEISTQVEKIYSDTSVLEQKESELLEKGKANKSPVVRRRVASELSQIRKSLNRQNKTAAVFNHQMNVLSSHIHNLTLIDTAKTEVLPTSEELTQHAVQAEEILETLTSDADLLTTLEPGLDSMTDEELAIMEEFDALDAKDEKKEPKEEIEAEVVENDDDERIAKLSQKCKNFKKTAPKYADYDDDESMYTDKYYTRRDES